MKIQINSLLILAKNIFANNQKKVIKVVKKIIKNYKYFTFA